MIHVPVNKAVWWDVDLLCASFEIPNKRVNHRVTIIFDIEPTELDYIESRAFDIRYYLLKD